MKVQSMAHILLDDVRCEPGDIIELREAVAELYLKEKLVKRLPEPVSDEGEADRPESENRAPEPEHPGIPGPEFAAFAGAPETALSRRGRSRKKRRRRSERGIGEKEESGADPSAGDEEAASTSSATDPYE